MEEFDLAKSFDELLKPTDPPKGAPLKNTTEALPTDPPEAVALKNTTEALPTDPPEAVALKNTTEASPTDPPEAVALKNTTEALPTDPPEAVALKNITGAPNFNSLESILPRLPPEGQAWLSGLNRFCRRAVKHDLRTAGPDLFVEYWESLRDTLQKLERDFGPSDNWM